MEAARPRERTAADEEAELRELAAPMAAGDAIERMLLAWKDRDYFRRAPALHNSTARARDKTRQIMQRWERAVIFQVLLC